MKLSPKNTYDLTAFIHTVCANKNGLAVYANGWNDETVKAHMTKVLGVNVTLDHVRYARQQNVGMLHKHSPKPPVKPVATAVIGIGNEAKAIADLAARVKRLEELIDRQQGELNQALDYITRAPRPQGGFYGPNGSR